MKAASAVSEGVFGHKLTQSEKKIAGTTVHYLLGTAVDTIRRGSGDSAQRHDRRRPAFRRRVLASGGRGGSALLGLSEGPKAYPLPIHAYALSSHFVYELTAEILRRAVRGAL